MACSTAPGFYYGPCGIYTMGLTAECPTEHPPFPVYCMCALMCSGGDVRCNGDCCIRSNVLWQHRHATRSVRSYWKEQKNERVMAAAEQPISQPNSPEEGLFKFGSVPRVLSYTPRWPMRNREMGSCLVRQSSGRGIGFEKAVSLLFVTFFKQEGGNVDALCLTIWGITRGVAKMCAGLFHKTSSSRSRSGFTCRASRRVWVTGNKLLMLNMILNIGWVFPYVALRLLFFYIWCSWVMWTSVEVSKHCFHSFTHSFTTSHQF